MEGICHCVKAGVFAIVLATLCCPAIAQVDLGDGADIYTNELLAFRDRVPSGLHDKTDRFRSQIRGRAKALETNDTLTALVAMSSGADDKDSTWCSLTIESYPRKAISEPNDSKAEALMSAWVAQSKDSGVLPRSVMISGQRFSVFLFGAQQGIVKKGAVVWTTVRRGKLLSFAFAANSPDQLKRLTESMKTLEFY